MKRLLCLLLCLLLPLLPCFAEEMNEPGFVGEWIETEGSGTLTIRLDGSATMVYDNGWVMDTTWAPTENGAAFGEGMWYHSPMQLLDENTLSVSDGWMIFAREGFLPATDPALLLGATPVGEEGAPFLGTWTLASLIMEGEELDPAFFGVTMTFTFNEDGTVVSDDGMEPYTTTWSVSYGSAVVEGDILSIDDEGRLVYNASDGQMIFVRDSISPSDAPSEEEQLLALMELMSQSEEDLSALPEAHQPFAGEWLLCHIATGGLSGDLRALGITGTLTLNADYTGVLSGIADEEGSWYEDEGVIRFGESGMPMFLLSGEEDGMGPFLQYGTEAGGYMIFHQDPEAVWTPGLYPLSTPVPAASAAPTAPAETNNSAGAALTAEVRYVCTAYTTAGFTMDASTLGAEYAVTFHAGGTADFTIAGAAVPGLPCTVTEDGLYCINYYGNLFNCSPTDAGFDMDFYGTMTMHFVPAE